MNIIIMGGPGSGKGTICKKLVNDFKYKLISAGDLLREEKASTIMKRLSSYDKQHRLYVALKEFGRIIKTCFILDIIDNVEFVGLISNREIIEYYKISNVFILTSFYETFGYVLIEAMCIGLPVIAIKNSGGPDEIVDKHVGLLSDSPSVVDVYKSMIEMYENYQQFNSKSIQEYCASKYSSKVVVPKIIKCYESIINNK